MDSEGRGLGLLVQRDHAGPGPAPRSPDVPERSGAAERPPGRRRRRRPRPGGCDVPHGSAPGQDRGPRHPSRRLGRPDCRPRARQAHPVRLAGDRDRGGQRRRRLRLRLQLRVHQHDLLAESDDAQSGGRQPAQAVRAPVRGRREHRRPKSACRSSGSKGRSSISFARTCRGCGPISEPTTAESWTSTPSRSGTSSGASRRPRLKAASRCRP